MAAADMYVTNTGAGDKSGSSWANAMSLTEFATDVVSNCEAGDRYFIMGGQTYTFTANINSARDGSAAWYWTWRFPSRNLNRKSDAVRYTMVVAWNAWRAARRRR